MIDGEKIEMGEDDRIGKEKTWLKTNIEKSVLWLTYNNCKKGRKSKTKKKENKNIPNK
jgi:hypothetical protein